MIIKHHINLIENHSIPNYLNNHNFLENDSSENDSYHCLDNGLYATASSPNFYT